MASHEAPKQKTELAALHFKPDAYYSASDPEYLDAFLDTVKKSGYDPQNLVFSGFDGSTAAKGEPIPKYDYIFAMNEPGWRAAVKYHEHNPAQYAEDWEVPCIGLYDKNQLAHGKTYGLSQDPYDLDGRVNLTDIKKGDNLEDLSPEVPVEEVVVHKDYPNASPTDALLGLVFIDRP